jgi:hypothetical protein
MSYSVIPKIRRDGKITLKDSGATNTLEIAYEDGNFTFNGLPTKEAQNIFRDRGVLTNIRKGDSEAPSSGSFSVHFRQFTSATAGSVLDFVNKTGAYSGNTSTGDTGTPRVEFYCIDIEYSIDGNVDGLSTTDHSATLTKCVVTAASFSEGDPSTLNLEFVCYGGVTFAEAT